MINQKNIFLYLNVINISKDPIDTDLEQIEEDWNASSQYRLVDDFVIQDGQTHPWCHKLVNYGFWLKWSIQIMAIRYFQNNDYC